MLTVPEAAKRIGRHPETVRRWIREGKLRSTKVGTQHIVDQDELDAYLDSEVLPLPPEWLSTADGEPMPNVVAIIRRQRAEH